MNKTQKKRKNIKKIKYVSGGKIGKRSRQVYACLDCGGASVKGRACGWCGGKSVHFHSKKEALRWATLHQMQRRGEIFKLRRQVRHKLMVDGQHITTWVADHEYYTSTGELVTEDVKGKSGGAFVMTEVAALKIALFEATHGRKVNVV